MFKCIDVEPKAFDDIKRIVSHHNLLEYMYLNKRFCIHTDTSNYQIGALIVQGEKPINLYIFKLTVPQTRYAVTQKWIY